MSSTLRRIFLSASVPDAGPDGDPAGAYLTQFAVRELVIAALGRCRLVWGGHPSITQLVHSVWTQFEGATQPPVDLYLSSWFEDEFTDADRAFSPTIVPKVPGDLPASLTRLRKTMIEQTFDCAVFVGGKDGLREEFDLFRASNPSSRVLLLRGPGGMAAQLPDDPPLVKATNHLDFSRIYASELDIDLTSERQLTDVRRRPRSGP